MKISIVIPTYNEASKIRYLITYLYRYAEEYIREIIVVDGGSTDLTVTIARQLGAKVIKTGKGRARQMNIGAGYAKSKIIYFLHADTYPPKYYARKIIEAVKEGHAAGSFRLKFDHKHWFLSLNSWFTKFNLNQLRFGDQSLFVTRRVFNRVGGFREDLLLLEDQDMAKRVKKDAGFKVVGDSVITSSRKYLLNGVYRLQAIFLMIYVLNFMGVSQTRLVKIYQSFVKETNQQANKD